MPYTLRKVRNKSCYRVVNKKTGQVKARCATRKNAEKQMRLLRALEHNPGFRKSFRRRSGGDADDEISHQHKIWGIRGLSGKEKAQSYCTDETGKVKSLSRTGKCLSQFFGDERRLVRCYGNDVYTVGTNLDNRILRDNEGFLTRYGKITPEKNCKDLGSGYYRHCWKYTKPNEKQINGTWERQHEGTCASDETETDTDVWYDAICSTPKQKDCFKPFLSPDFTSLSPDDLMKFIDEGNLDQVAERINQKSDLNFIYTGPLNPPKHNWQGYQDENSKYLFHGYSPLNWAVKKFSENPKAENLKQIIIKLLESGANPNLPLSHQYDTKEFGKKSDIIESYKNNDLQYTPLHFAVLSGDVDVVRELMSKGALTSAKGREPQKIMEEFIENGVKKERWNDVYVTPLELAIQLKCSKELVDSMLPRQDE